MKRFHYHEKLAHYAKEACDIEYKFPFGYGEINGTHNRTDFDLSRHQEFSKQSMEYIDPQTNERFIPYIIESTVGVDRLVLAILFNSYDKEETENGTREVMRFLPKLAPYKVAVLPLIKKVHTEEAEKIFDLLSDNFDTTVDFSGSIGKRYRRQDIMGTPYCVTIDNDTLEKGTVTVRDRDTMEQTTIKVSELVSFLAEKM